MDELDIASMLLIIGMTLLGGVFLFADDKPRTKKTSTSNRRLNGYIEHLKYEFYSLDFCVNETARLYRRVLDFWDESNRANKVACKKLLNYCVLKVKEVYKFKLPYQYDIETYTNGLEQSIIDKVEELLPSLRQLTPNEEKKLYSYDSERWKYKYNEILSNYSGDPNNFEKHIQTLADLCNFRFTTQREIFYKAYLFLADKHKHLSLKFYLQYLHVKTTTDNFKHKPISQRNSKRLFTDEKEVKEFTKICDILKWNRNLHKALEKLELLCQPKRKQIKLNVEAIQDAGSKHRKVAKLLDEYLSAEEDTDVTQPNPLPVEPVKNDTADTVKEFLGLFISNGYCLTTEEVNIFVNEKGLFKDTFIDNINECYYEQLDDLLIEHENNNYLLIKDYYQQIAE